eukprot:1019172-Lingulodinium_polyedra.AAC.1
MPTRWCIVGQQSCDDNPFNLKPGSNAQDPPWRGVVVKSQPAGGPSRDEVEIGESQNRWRYQWNRTPSADRAN